MPWRYPAVAEPCGFAAKIPRTGYGLARKEAVRCVSAPNAEESWRLPSASAPGALRRSAPGAEAEGSRQLSSAFGADTHLTASFRAKPYPVRGIFAANPQGSATAGYLQGMSPQPPVRVLIADDH